MGLPAFVTFPENEGVRTTGDEGLTDLGNARGAEIDARLPPDIAPG